MSDEQPMNMYQFFAKQHEVSKQQYQENLTLVEDAYEALMKAEQESFQRMQSEHEQRMVTFAELRKGQIIALKKQYAIDD